MSDTPEYPVINISGSEDWRDYYSVGEKLEASFPGQDARDFAMAYGFNDAGPLRGDAAAITSLVMLERGENDEADWLWYVQLADGDAWLMGGGCDYTGWDCQSDNWWLKVKEAAYRPLRVETYRCVRGRSTQHFEYRWRVVHTSNGEIMASGEGYTAQVDRDHAVSVLFPGVEVVEVEG